MSEIQQIRFYDTENETELGGFLIDNKYIVCACCGGITEVDDEDYPILEVYPEWADLSDCIIGDEA